MKAAAIKTRTRFESILFATDFSAAATNAIPFIKKTAAHSSVCLIAQGRKERTLTGLSAR